jgi:hypothetical protein
VTGNGRAAMATSLAWGQVVAVAGYALMRSVQVILGHEPDPARIGFNPHSAFFWRSLTTLYAGGIASFVACVASRGRLPAFARGLAVAIPITTLLVALQALFFP